MADFNSGDAVRFGVQWKFAGFDDQVNVLHAALSGTVPADPDLVYEDFTEWLIYVYEPAVGLMHPQVQHYGVAITNVSQNTVHAPIPAIPALDGMGVGEALPPQVTALCVMATSVPRVQGRVYLPTFDESSNDNGALTGSALSNVNAFGARLRAAFTGTNGTVIRYVVRRESGITLFASFQRAVSSYRTQRRRTAGRGS